MIGTALVAATVALQLIDGNLTFAIGLAVLLLAPELYLPVRMVGQHFHASTDGLEAAGQLFEVLDTPAAVSAPARPLPAPDARSGAIELDDVRVAYPGRGAPVLDGLSCGSSRASSSRSSARAARARARSPRCCCGCWTPTRARCAATASTCARARPQDWRRQVAWVPQRATLFAGTLEDNVRLGDPDASGRGAAAGARGRRPRAARRALPGRRRRRASATAAARCRPARRSASRWRARSCATRRCSCSTSRPRTSTPRRPRTSAPRSSGSRPGARRC